MWGGHLQKLDGSCQNKVEGEAHGENVFLKVESVDEIALRFHCKTADERPVFDDPNWQ
jgi:hypothetical protein